MPIRLPDADRARSVEALQAWFRDERGEAVGTLPAEALLDVVLAEVGPAVYAAALADVQAHLRSVVDDLDLVVMPEPPSVPGVRRSARR